MNFNFPSQLKMSQTKTVKMGHCIRSSACVCVCVQASLKTNEPGVKHVAVADT